MFVERSGNANNVPAPDRRPGGVVVKGMTFRYAGEEQPVFAGFDWQVAQGERWAIVGRSGCGKTTLLNLMAGLQQPTAGAVLVNGHPVPRPRADTGLILQQHGLLPWATVRQNATLGLRVGRFYRNKQNGNSGGSEGLPRPYPPNLPLEEADHWLERLGIAHLRDKYPGQISGGQRQRVAIARTLALRPSLLLMDEPFSALDAATREALQDLVLGLQAELSITTILVTHAVDEAVLLGRRILVLQPPPNREATVVENPDAGDPGYRESDTYVARGRAIRRRLETGEQ